MATFVKQQRGAKVASTALMGPMSHAWEIIFCRKWVVARFQVMKSADPYPVIPAGIAGIQAPGMAKAVGVESLSRTTMSL